ncbi:MAG: hypothetical protein A2541_01350 [Candidatus Taylorbacteria bacterium RIFOXYD2_FULL_36_9]|uniref:Glycosyltransferase 2-like domain-containing protein n=1 Tax=Candidatus Taylorbacteria bacterium RIFOXYD2_FULL_36_9 TaxID=1802338 RepID=A0A1G2PGB7_9BACT|nr:MAG: hypothetical protein A2541_01350 [Candidatus Taylorbacteria bacterium RIFOXYD2_FULL_36_9]
MKDSKPLKISIIMLNYNGLKYLEKTLSPLLVLDYPDYEFIVVDNGSTDGSLEYIKKETQVILLQSPKMRAKNFACNYAVNMAQGEFILLLDNDCLITEKGILTSLLNCYNLNQDCGLLGLAFYNLGENFSFGYGGFFSRWLYLANNKKIKNDLLAKFDGQFIGFPHGLALFVKKTVWQKLDGYDENLIFGGDDNDLGIKSWLLGYKNYLYSQSSQIHLGEAERRDNNKYAIKFKEIFYAHLYTIVKNFTFINLWPALIGQIVFMFFKSIKQSIFRFYFGPFFAFGQGLILFFKKIPIACQKRKEIQIKRKEKRDVFLKIKPQKIKK